MSGNTTNIVSPPTPAWVIKSTVYITAGSYNLMLSGGHNGVTGKTEFSGSLDFSGNKLNLNELVNSLLSTFSLQLPASLPVIKFKSISGSIVTSAPTAISFNSESDIIIPDPFNVSKTVIQFRTLILSVTHNEAVPAAGSTAAIPATTYVGISAEIDFNTPAGVTAPSAGTFGSARLIFFPGQPTPPSGQGSTPGQNPPATSGYIIALTIRQVIDTATLLESALGKTISSQVRGFLPSFSPLSATQPMWLYLASHDYTYNGTNSAGVAETVVFKQGFNIDHAVVTFKDLSFPFTLNINNGVNFTAYAPAFAVVPGFLEITHQSTSTVPSSGMMLEVSSATDSVGLQAGIKFTFASGSTNGLPNPLTLNVGFGFSATTKTFSGDVSYPGTIAGITNPKLGFTYSKTDGFKISSLPVDYSLLIKAIDWAKQIMNFANSQPSQGCMAGCKQIVDLAISQTLTTTVGCQFKPSAATTPGKFALLVTGSYKIAVFGRQVDDIVFAPFTVEITIPKGLDDLADAIATTLLANVDNIADGLFRDENKVQLIKLLSYITFTTGAAEAICRLKCRYENELEKEIDDAETEAETTESAADAAVAAEGGIAAAGIGAAAGAAEGAADVLAGFAAFLAWLFGTLSAAQQAKKDAAEKKKDDAEKRIRQLLTIPTLTATYSGQGSAKQIIINWGDVPAVTKAGETIEFGVKVLENGVQVFSQTNARSGRSATLPHCIDGRSYSLNVTATFNNEKNTYEGPVKSLSVTPPGLAAPTPTFAFDTSSLPARQLGKINVSWGTVSPVPAGSGAATQVNNTGFTVELYNETTGIVAYTTTINDPNTTTCSFELYQTNAPLATRFFPNPIDVYQVRIVALASNSAMNSMAGISAGFSIPWGVGYMRVGYNFKIK